MNPTTNNSKALAIVSRNRSRFEAPPQFVPAGQPRDTGHWKIWEGAGTKIDAPLLGNGDMLSAFSGEPHCPQFWVTTNDFWQLESAPWEYFHDNSSAKYWPASVLGGPRPVGRIVFDIPAMKDATYVAEQDFVTATTTATFEAADGNVLKIASWVAAGENLLVVEFNSTGTVSVGVDFKFPNQPGWGVDQYVDFEGKEQRDESLVGTFVGLIGGRPTQQLSVREGVLSGSRSFEEKVDRITRVAFAGRFATQKAPVTIESGKPAVYVFAMRSWAKVSRPQKMADSRVRWITQEDLDRTRSMHLLWWRDYWSVSHVELDDPVLERRYYLSQYVMGSTSRDPDYPPNILGIGTFDRPAWNGDYKINYNHQAPYLGLLVSGHFEQADTHDTPYLALMDLGKEMSLRLLGHDGVYLPLGLGPVGTVCESLLLHMKSPAVHGSTNMGIRWYLTRDREYARRVYPFLRSMADFWEGDLVMEEGRYRVCDDGMHERDHKEVAANGVPGNATNTLGYLRALYRLVLDVADDLNVDRHKFDTWNDILTHLSPYPSGPVSSIDDFWRGGEGIGVSDLLPPEVQDREVFYNEEYGGKWSIQFPGNVMQIYPAGEIGLDSDPKLLEIARNTIEVRSIQEHRLEKWKSEISTSTGKRFEGRRTGAWQDVNISSQFFPAAVRIGFDPQVIWDELADYVSTRGLPNGFIRDNPHGIENCSTVPNTIQEMMLLSHEGVLRFFEVWPRMSHPNARFAGLRAYGAFVVCAALKDGTVCEVSIRSEKGKNCVVQNPWPGHDVQIRRLRSEPETATGKRFSIETYPGECVTLEPIE